MKNFNQEEFNDFIIQNNVIGFFKEPIKLKSGRLSNWYVNWRTVADDVFLLDKLTDYVIKFTDDLNLKPDCFYGVPEGATKLAVVTQYKFAKKQKDFSKGKYALPMGRGKQKDHGDPKDKYFVGMPKGKTIVIEDVTTTGGSLIDTIKILQESKIQIIAAIGVTNRNELRDDKKSVEEAVKEKNVPYYAMSNSLELLPKICKKVKPTDDVIKLVEEYFEKYGIEKMRLR